MKAHRLAIVTVVAVVAAFLAQGSAKDEATTTRKASGPRSIHSKTQPPQLPVKNYGIGIVYYSVRGDLQSTLTLNNKGPAALFPTVTLYARDGRSHRVDGLTVNGRSFLELALRDLAAAAGPGFEDGSLRVAYAGRALELGGMLTMTNLDTGVEWYDQLMYGGDERSNRLEGVWWLPNEATDARLVVTNASTAPVDVTVTFNGTTPARAESFRLDSWQLQVLDFGKPSEPGAGPRDGLFGGISIEYTGAAGGVLARGFISNANAGYSSVVAFEDPAEAKTARYHAGGVHVQPVGRAAMEPVIVARNVSPGAATVTGRLQVTGPGGELNTVDLPATALGPGETRAIDARAAWSRAAELSTQPTVGLELEHDAAPGGVVFSAASVSQDLSHVFHAPLTDPETLPSGTGGYFWRVEDTRTSLVVLKNMTDEPQRYNLQIRYEGGVWAPGLRVIEPHQTVVLDVGELQALQVPDAKDRTIPMAATRGQVHWSSSGRGGRGIVGRMEHADLARGVSSTYACPMPTNDIFVDAWIVPDYWEIEVGDIVPFEVWELDEDAFGGGLQPEYEITDILWWQSFNTSVAGVVGPGAVRGVGNGFTGIRASGESNGWATYDPSEGDPENHVSIDLFGDADVQQCVGDATRSAIRQEYVDHQQGHTNFFATGLPSCSDFTSSRSAVYFSFNEINTGDYSVALVRDPLIAPSTAGYGLDKWRLNYGSARIINSAFRNPVRNTAVGGAPGDSNPGGNSGSRHMYGDAADLRNDTAGGGADPNDPEDPANAARLAEWTAMETAARDADADFLEPISGPCKMACFHADWRNKSGGYQ